MNKQESRSSFTAAPGPAAPLRAVVETSARLHIGFMDLNFDLGRRFGSLGFAIDKPVTRLEAAFSGAPVRGEPDTDRAARYAASMCERLSIEGPVKLTVHDAIPAHAGLGSGTQLALATGHAVAALTGRTVSSRQVAAILGRGGRSGVGIATFDHGGIVLDAGKHQSGEEPPPVVWRHSMPEDWRFVLVFDGGASGVHGEQEKSAFRQVQAMAPEICGAICRLTLMQVVPSVMERDVAAFGAAVTKIQAHVGDYFAPWQGGSRFFSKHVADALAWAAANGAAGIGQSSWGPTGYAIAANATEATHLANGLRERVRGQDKIEIAVASPVNRGARISTSTV